MKNSQVRKQTGSYCCPDSRSLAERLHTRLNQESLRGDMSFVSESGIVRCLMRAAAVARARSGIPKATVLFGFRAAGSEGVSEVKQASKHTKVSHIAR